MGCGVSKQVHQEEIETREAEIARLNQVLQERDNEISGMVPREELEAVRSQAEEQLAEGDAERERELQNAQLYHNQEIAKIEEAVEAERLERQELEKKIEILSKTLHVTSGALRHVSEYPVDEHELEEAKTKPPPIPDVDTDIHKAIVNDESILPTDIQEAVTVVQENMREIENMKAAVKMSQDKVAEYWKRVVEHETALIELKKRMLIVENQNEQLKLKATSPRRRLSSTTPPKSASPSPPHKLGTAAIHQYEFVTS
eukprot:m.27667 g.27667  ORF g.27667 m.27667 type:complete len:258 (-) comp7919_c0_seq1:84-857(-)